MIKQKVFALMSSSYLASCAITRLLNIKNYPFNKYIKEIERRAEFDIWEYLQLSEEMKPYYADSTPNSSYYGIAYNIKKYAGIDKIIGFNAEHGLYFGDYVEPESMGKSIRLNVTMSQKRKNIINKESIAPSVSIGPYIYYAPEYYTDDELRTIKKKLGKTLLVFPPHSTRTVNAAYDHDLFFDYLKKERDKYDTVMVCLFYKDIQRGEYKHYEKKGYLVVTAGHMFDCNFLSRQKAMIELADETVSTSAGTHIGYCIFLGKNHTIIDLSANNENGNKHKSIDKDCGNQILKNIVRPAFEVDEDLMLNTFLNTKYSDEKKKEEIASEFWGFSSLMSKDELKARLENIRK